jgi:plastocyanin
MSVMHVQSRSRSLRRGTLAAVAAVGILAAGCTGAAPEAATPAATPALAANVEPVATPAPTAKPTPSPTAAIVVVTPVPNAEESNVVDQLESLDAKWSKTVLTAPAGKLWHVAVDATDPLGMHNFTLTSGPAVEQRLFQSRSFGVGLHTFDLPALPAGTYTFICTLHPDTMHGTVEVS